MKITSLRPLTAARAIRDLFANPNDTQYVFEIIDALQGPSLHHMCNRLRGTERGRRLLAEQPNPVPLLNDREGLRALPEGSLGRAYLTFVEAEGISADGLVDASMGVCRSDETAELVWAHNWLRDTHDLWHAVLGYQGDLLGEAALLAFTHYQTRNIGTGVIVSVAWYKLGRVTEPDVRARSVILDGRRRAKQTAWFLDVPWHEWLARPLADIRHDLGVVGPAEYQQVRSHEVDMTLIA
ncbi:MAG: hypothetical protein DRH30_13550 [Deltaproteobacteria bacterium]|nr:MAG: hypothetical protein DRH30_13550 [Deltaproteobacteria bacterium]